MTNTKVYNTVRIPRINDGSSYQMNVSYYRPSKHGPELKLESTIADNIQNIFSTSFDCWAAASPQIGAGLPDILVASFRPEIAVFSKTEMPNADILAYLRAVGHARIETISSRLQIPKEIIVKSLNELVEFNIVQKDENSFSLFPKWRTILPDIITIEVKVDNWKKVIQQAARNQIFSHKSYIALPYKVAYNIRDEQSIKELGLGILSIDTDNRVKVIRRSRRKNPKVWRYYYEIASLVANYYRNAKNLNDVYISNRASKTSLSGI